MEESSFFYLISERKNLISERNFTIQIPWLLNHQKSSLVRKNRKIWSKFCFTRSSIWSWLIPLVALIVYLRMAHKYLHTHDRLVVPTTIILFLKYFSQSGNKLLSEQCTLSWNKRGVIFVRFLLEVGFYISGRLDEMSEKVRNIIDRWLF